MFKRWNSCRWDLAKTWIFTEVGIMCSLGKWGHCELFRFRPRSRAARSMCSCDVAPRPASASAEASLDVFLCAGVAILPLNQSAWR